MRTVSALLAAAMLASCGTLPQDGPSTRAVVGSKGSSGPTYAIVDLSYAAAEVASRPRPILLGGLAAAPAAAAYDLIGEGDVLAVSVLEPGGSLFGAASPTTGAPPGTASQGLPPLLVDRSGAVTVPFAGRVAVAGLTAQQASEAIRRALRGRAVNPQVIVTVQESANNGVTVLGAATAPGRLALKRGSDTVLDAIAAAGGPTSPPEDIVVSITRAGRTVETPMSSLLVAPVENIKLAPGDQLNLLSRPRQYTTFGALGKVAQVNMPSGDVTLTGALGVAGGLDNQSSDARAVFIFRFEEPEVARALGVAIPPMAKGVPVIYRLNLAEPAGFFTANTFLIQPGDIIYNPRANSAELRKFFEFVQAITRVIYDVTITGTLNID